MANVDLEKARRLMSDQGLAAMLATSPENFYYVTGFSSGHAHLRLGLAGPPALAVLPAEQDVPPAVIIGDVEAKGLSLHEVAY